jgi:CRP-like cAMP-binding protein
MILASDARRNDLLAAVPEATLLRWLPLLERVELPLGAVLFSSQSRIDHVYFPTTAIVAMVYLTQEGDLTEVAIVGHEGVVGVASLMGSDSSSRSAVVQSAGECLRLRAPVLVAAYENGGAVMHLLSHYIQALMTQIVQTAVCNRFHSVDQQVCRWLLLSLDRVQGNELAMTHELIANMLGVRREGVTHSAMKLHNCGAIRYTRGHISVLDREALEERACECYAVVKREYQRLLPAPAARVSLLAPLVSAARTRDISTAHVL